MRARPGKGRCTPGSKDFWPYIAVLYICLSPSITNTRAYMYPRCGTRVVHACRLRFDHRKLRLCLILTRNTDDDASSIASDTSARTVSIDDDPECNGASVR